MSLSRQSIELILKTANLRQNSTTDDFCSTFNAGLNAVLKPCIKYGFQPNCIAKRVNLISGRPRGRAARACIAGRADCFFSRVYRTGAHNGYVRAQKPQPEDRHRSIVSLRIPISLLTAAALSTGCRIVFPPFLPARASCCCASIEFYPNPNKLKALLR
jgi:hypothetical protein